MCVMKPLYTRNDRSSSAMFSCIDDMTKVLPCASVKIKLVYKPKLVHNSVDISYFSIQAHGGCSVKIKCIGQSKGKCGCCRIYGVLFSNCRT